MLNNVGVLENKIQQKKEPNELKNKRLRQWKNERIESERDKTK